MAFSEEVVSARDRWVRGNSVRQQPEEIRKKHADGLDIIRQEHKDELAKVDADRRDAVKAFDALQKSSIDREKQLQIDVANANTRTERLQLAVKEATTKLIGKFSCLRLLCGCSLSSCYYTNVAAGSSEIGDAADLVSTERRLKALKDAAEDIVRVGLKCLLHLAPNESYEGTFTQFLRWVGQVPVVTDGLAQVLLEPLISSPGCFLGTRPGEGVPPAAQLQRRHQRLPLALALRPAYL